MTSDAAGSFVLPSLPVGTYSVEIEATGFKKFVEPHVEVTLGHVINLNPVLQLGEVTQAVEVPAEAAQVETTLEFRGEFFNIVNHAQFSEVDGNISDGQVSEGGTFGKVIRARDPRLIQFALKLLF